MEFRKKLKIRRYTAYVIIALGILMIVVSAWRGNEYLSSLGSCFLILGIARIVQHKRITRSEESLHQREIAETDERNIKLWTEARSLAVSVYLFAAGVAIIILQLLGLSGPAQWISWAILGFVLIYWLCYAYVRRKY